MLQNPVRMTGHAIATETNTTVNAPRDLVEETVKFVRISMSCGLGYGRQSSV